ncbi:hypothetical protein EC973_004542 [Apophysomyces ossiformis]|uniref:Uncharacterized protein n=1 Tax=Apophysomyces ossiformis TaxID=679940 RepID=A0A8H7BEJ4_9FUNG|nr:hypothetical protein EC973_004542 [Apophysomyces ossiformis]
MDRIDMVSGIVPFKPSAIHPPMNPLAHPPPHPFPHPPPFKATKPTWSPELGGRPSFVPSPVTNVPSPSKTLLPVMETPVSTVLSMSHTSVVSDIISVIGNAPDLAVKSLLRPFNMALASALQEFPRIFKGIIETEYADIASKSFAAISSKGVPTWASSK